MTDGFWPTKFLVCHNFKVFYFQPFSSLTLEITDESVEMEEIDELDLLLAEANAINDNEKGQNTLCPPSFNVSKDIKFLTKPLETILSPTNNEFSDRLNKSLDDTSSTKGKTGSVIHTAENDSSDDEDAANFLERKYNEYGQGIQAMLKQKAIEHKDKQISKTVDKCLNEAKESWTSLPKPHKFPDYKPAPPPPQQSSNIGIYTDPVFGIRIIHPLISSSVLQERMNGRTAVNLANLPKHLSNNDLSKDWAIAGVILSKSPMQTSKKGAQYAIWKLSDLHGEIQNFTLFLFKTACKDLWKTAVGMVVAILNPRVMENSNSSKDKMNIACLSVDTTQKFLILGQSKDLGSCKSRKKNGEPCNAIVNLRTCEYCVFHVKKEYGNMCGRSELQSATSGRGLQNLRNKVLGKSEVFYGGQSFMAIPAKKNPKMAAKDQNRLMKLSEYCQSTAIQNSAKPMGSPTTVQYATASNFVSKVAGRIESNVKQRQQDLERLKILATEGLTSDSISNKDGNTTLKSSTSQNLSGEIKTNSIVSSKEQIPSNPRQFSAIALQKTTQKPQLKQEGFSFEINVSLKKSEALKSKAAAILKKKPIEKSNPNFIKYRGTESGKKRVLDEIGINSSDNNNDDDDGNHATKKQKLTDEAEKFRNERIKKIMETKSSHTDLIEKHQNDQQEQYFNKLEKKEAMEEKMLNTFTIDCKAVICMKCKYTAFSASDRCKDEKHPLKIIDGQKRFFECEDCGNRTATLHRIPQLSCKNCQSSRWKRAAMIKERKNERIADKLSIRGDEETFIGSLNSNVSNINLCVPDN